MTFDLNDYLFTIDVNNFESQVIEYSNQTPILIDFWAEWCPPCLVISPILKNIIISYQGKVALGKVEVDEGENMKLAGRYQTRGFPSVLLILNGIELNRFTGAQSEHFISNFLKENLDNI